MNFFELFPEATLNDFQPLSHLSISKLNGLLAHTIARTTNPTAPLHETVDELKEFCVLVNQIALDKGIDLPKAVSDAFFGVEADYQIIHSLDADDWEMHHDPILTNPKSVIGKEIENPIVLSVTIAEGYSVVVATQEEADRLEQAITDNNYDDVFSPSNEGVKCVHYEGFVTKE